MILADGCFDPLHVGHLRYLKAADCGSPLVVIVRVAPDADIRAKGREPFQTVSERMELIRGLGFQAITTTTLPLAIHKLKPLLLVKGDDWQGRVPAEVLAACEECGTAIRFTPTSGRTSTQRLA